MKFHEAMARELLGQGIDTVFGLLGDGNLFILNSFREQGGRFVSVAHEASGVLAAVGYGSTSGRLAVATVTHGPGLTNTVTALLDGVRGGMPAVLLAGDTAVADLGNVQSVRQREVVEASEAGFVQVRAPHTGGEDLRTAIRRAFAERRPIVLNIPTEFQWLDVDFAPLPPLARSRDAIRPDPEVLGEAVGVIAAARRPIVLAGRGAISPEARAELLRLAARIGAPLATSLRARELFRGESRDLGIFGTLSHEVANETILQSDLVIAFGASLNRWTTAQGSLLADRAVIQVDSDPRALGDCIRPTIAVQGDAVSTARAFVELLDEAEIPATGFASTELEERLARSADAMASNADKRRRDQEGLEARGERKPGTVEPLTAMRALHEAFPSERTLVTDAGRFTLLAWPIFKVEHPSAYVHTVNFGSIGLGMASALGAAIGSDDRPTLLIVGDGGFMLGGVAEFNSAVRHGLDLVVIVFNDGGYGAEHVQLYEKGLETSIIDYEWPDFAAVAASLGGSGITVRALEDLDRAAVAICDRDRPLLIDVRMDPDEISRSVSATH